MMLRIGTKHRHIMAGITASAILVMTACGDDSGPATADASGDGPVGSDAASDAQAKPDTGTRDSSVNPDAYVIPEATMYVDPSLDQDQCLDYAPDSRRCGAGSYRAYKSLSDAAAQAAAGDVVVLREGEYNLQLKPENSGRQDAPLIFAAQPGEQALFSGDLRPAFDLSGLEYVVVQGLVVQQTMRWVALDESHHCTIRDNAFLGATEEGAGSKSGIWLRRATYNRIVNNRLEDSPEDAMALIDADRNVIQGNTFRNAGHALWAIRCGDENIVRGNSFYNEEEKIGEIYDCDGQSGVSDYDATKRNLVEENDFAYVPSSGDSAPYSGIQFAGQDTIIRRNIFHSTVGPGLSMALYGQEARHNRGNRICHNVFYGTDYAGLEIARGDTMEDNVLANNIFAKSAFVANDQRWDWWVNVLDGKPVQIMAARLDAFFLLANCIYYDETTVGSPWLLIYGWRSPGWDEQHPISWWETNYPDLVEGTVETNPEFLDADSLDFHLNPQSPLVDMGVFLTHVRQSGSGSTVPVDDSRWFSDGFQIPGETGDVIRLEGTETRARVVSVDVTSQTITLDQSLDFTQGQGVSLDYQGQAPDIGAYETP